MIKRRTRRLLGLVALTAATACAGPRMVPPSDVAGNSRVIDAIDRSRSSGAFVDESFELGEYGVTNVDRDWTSKNSMSIGPYGEDSTTAGYTYQFTVGNETLKGKCASFAESERLQSGYIDVSLVRSNELVCECSAGASLAVVKISGPEHSRGVVDLGDAEYVMQAVSETDMVHLAGGPVGYRVDGGDTPVAAVEVLHPGRIWFDQAVSKKDETRMSCVFAGLMLYVPPRDN